MRSILEFIKYNNAVPLILAVLMLGTGVAFAANPAVREALFPTDSGPIGPPPAAEARVLLATDPKDFDMAFHIDSVIEAGESYRIGYSYRTFEVANNVWQVVSKTKELDIPKTLLGKRDLGLYAAEQIGQVMDREIAYLSEVRTQALKPELKTSVSREYAGLVGRSLDTEERRFDGYKPVVKEAEEAEEKQKAPKETVDIELPGGTVPVSALLSKEEVRQIIIDAVASFLAIDTTPVAPTPDPVELDAVPDETVPAEPEPEDSGEAGSVDESGETTPETAASDPESAGE